jgi:ribosomal protein L35
MALKLKTRKTAAKRFSLETKGHRLRGVTSFKRHGEAGKRFLTNAKNEQRFMRMLPYGC